MRKHAKSDDEAGLGEAEGIVELVVCEMVNTKNQNLINKVELRLLSEVEQV